jgi:aminoglycoside 6'-N-acetyltransferase I
MCIAKYKPTFANQGKMDKEMSVPSSAIPLNLIRLHPLAPGQALPIDLLLLADPSPKLIEKYIQGADLYEARLQKARIGIIVLMPINKQVLEIKNLAVIPEFQARGIGSFMIHWATDLAREKGYREICIGTANSSIGQLRLYQKLGFEITRIKKNFFLNHYDEVIVENGIQAKHMLMLSKMLHQKK